MEKSVLKNVLEIIRSVADNRKFLYVLTAINPTIFNESGLNVSESGSGRTLFWYLTKKMSTENMISLSSKLITNSKKDAEILLKCLLLTDGHYRSIESVILKFYDINYESFASSLDIKDLIFSPNLVDTLDPKIKNNWMYLAAAILQLKLDIRDNIIIGRNILSRIIKGVFLNEIDVNEYLNEGDTKEIGRAHV